MVWQCSRFPVNAFLEDSFGCKRWVRSVFELLMSLFHILSLCFDMFHVYFFQFKCKFIIFGRAQYNITRRFSILAVRRVVGSGPASLGRLPEPAGG